MTEKLTAARLRELLHYDPETGWLTWLVSQPNGAEAGARGGHRNEEGYRQIRVCGRTYMEHRLIWLHQTGDWPKQFIDHINGVKDDNRFVNLRDVSKIENRHNQRKAQKNSRTGLLGVWECKWGGYGASIQAHGKRHWLGMFPTPEDAHQAYVKAKRQLHPTGTL